MDERVEIRRDQFKALIFALACLGGGAAACGWYLWAWVNHIDLRRPYGGGGGGEGLIFVGLLAVGFGLWGLWKLGDSRVKVAVDRQGITDFRLADVPIPWTEVERVEHMVIRKTLDFRRYRCLRLVIRANSHLPGLYLGRREVLIWDSGLKGGDQALKEAVSRLAPQVPRNWQD